jgi:hypothetical protein
MFYPCETPFSEQDRDCLVIDKNFHPQNSRKKVNKVYFSLRYPVFFKRLLNFVLGVFIVSLGFASILKLSLSLIFVTLFLLSRQENLKR